MYKTAGLANALCVDLCECSLDCIARILPISYFWDSCLYIVGNPFIISISKDVIDMKCLNTNSILLLMLVVRDEVL